MASLKTMGDGRLEHDAQIGRLEAWAEPHSAHQGRAESLGRKDNSMRTVDEWIGKTDDAMPSDGCKRRILDRQGWICAVSGVGFTDGVRAEFDHITPLWLGGENRESNLQAITAKAHAAKTKNEATVRAKVNANRINRVGGKKKSSLSTPRFKKMMNGTVVDRRTGEVISR